MTDGVDPTLAAALEELFGIPPAELHADARLEADLAMDSLSIVELQVALEDRLGVRVDAEDPAAVRTVGKLSAVIDGAVQRGTPAVPRLQLSEEA